MSLSRLAEYIKTTSHLPEIPSSAQIKKDGLDLGFMQKLQMQKIEELTLYAIDADKKLQQEDTAIAIQRIQLQEEQSKNTRLEQQLNTQLQLLILLQRQMKSQREEIAQLKKIGR